MPDSTEVQEEIDELLSYVNDVNFSVESEASKAQTKTEARMVKELVSLQNQMKRSSRVQWALTGAIVLFSLVQIFLQL